MAGQVHPEEKRYAVAIWRTAPGTATFPELFMTRANISLEEEYRLTRTALVNAGLNMTGSMDALYRDWRRWRDKSASMAPLDSIATQEKSTNGGLGIWPSSGAWSILYTSRRGPCARVKIVRREYRSGGDEYFELAEPSDASTDRFGCERPPHRYGTMRCHGSPARDGWSSRPRTSGWVSRFVIQERASFVRTANYLIAEGQAVR